MSKCISRSGEFSDHVPDDKFGCTRCFAFDEDAALARIAALESLTAPAPVDVEALTAWLDEYEHIVYQGGDAVVIYPDAVAPDLADYLALAPLRRLSAEEVADVLDPSRVEGRHIGTGHAGLVLHEKQALAIATALAAAGLAVFAVPSTDQGKVGA